MQYNLICAEEWLSLLSKIKPLFFCRSRKLCLYCKNTALHNIQHFKSEPRHFGQHSLVLYVCISACTVQRMHLGWPCSKLQIATWVRTARNFWFTTCLILKIKLFWRIRTWVFYLHHIYSSFLSPLWPHTLSQIQALVFSNHYCFTHTYTLMYMYAHTHNL